MDDCEGDGLQQPQPSVEMETQISQVDNNIEEEMVMPVQVATMDLVTSSHNDDSGCTSDGDHSEDEDDGGGSHATITRQNTYTVKSAITGEFDTYMDYWITNYTSCQDIHVELEHYTFLSVLKIVGAL